MNLTLSERSALWQRNNPGRVKEIQKASRARIIHNPRRLAARRRNAAAYYAANKATVIDSHRRWRAANPWAKEADNYRALIRGVINGGLDGGKMFRRVVGCTGRQLRGYLEARWLPGMTWENFGRGGWTIGHKLAVAHFKDLPEGVSPCFHFLNLQPEWERSNRAKYTSKELTAAQAALDALDSAGQYEI